MPTSLYVNLLSSALLTTSPINLLVIPAKVSESASCLLDSSSHLWARTAFIIREISQVEKASACLSYSSVTASHFDLLYVKEFLPTSSQFHECCESACWRVLCKCMLDIRCSVLRGWSCAITKSFEFWLRTVEKMGLILSLHAL